MGVLLSACATREEANNRPHQSDAIATALLEKPENSSSIETSESISQDIAFSTIQDIKDQEELRSLEMELNAPNRMPSQALPASSYLNKENLSAELFNAKAVTAQDGDCLTKMALNYLGSSEEWPRIAHLNPQIKDPHQKIAAGEKVYVPAPRALNPQKISAFHESPNPKHMSRGIASVEETTNLKTKSIPLLKDKVFFKTKHSNYKNSINDQIKEQAKFAKYKKKKFKKSNLPLEEDRKVASSDEDLENDIALRTHQNLSKAISALGILLMLAVFLSFFFSRPEKK